MLFRGFAAVVRRHYSLLEGRTEQVHCIRCSAQLSAVKPLMEKQIGRQTGKMDTV